MTKAILGLLTIFLISGSPGSAGNPGASQGKPYFAFEVGGKDAGALTSYANNTVTPTQPGLGQAPDPGSITIVSGQGMNPSFYQWLGSALAGKKSSSACAIVTIGPNNQETSKLKMASARINEVRIPALDSNSHAAGRLTLKIAPGQQQLMNSGATHQALGGSIVWEKSDFKLDIPGVNCSHVSKIEPIRIRLNASQVKGRLTITLPRSAASDFLNWQVNSTKKHSGKLRLLHGNSTLLEVAFHDLHLETVSTGAQVKVEMASDRVEVTGS